MKKMIMLIMCLGLILMAGSAQATLLTFDDIGTGGTLNNYGGLTWSGMGYLNGHTLPGSGYENGIVSEDYVAYNMWASISSITDGLFNFDGAYFTAAWNTGLSIMVEGFLNGNVIPSYITTFTVNTTEPTWFDFDYMGINEIRIASLGGTDYSSTDGGSGTHFVMDNFTYTPVPEPGTLLLLGGGLVGLAFYARRRKQS